MKIKKGVFFIFILFIFFIFSCIQVEAKDNIKLNKTKTTLYVGQNTTLKVNNATNKVKWSSSKKSVVTVSSKGKVIAKKKGTATITAKVGKKKLNCKVTVKNPYLNKAKITLKKGQSTILKLIGTKVKSWSSSNKKVVTINSKGKIVGKNYGKARITCKGRNGKTYKCEITIEKKHNHKYVSDITEKATCTKDGILTYSCSCGDTYTKKITKTGHNSSDWILEKKANCKENGSRYKECTKCKTKLKTESIAKKNHSYENSIITKSPLCMEYGEKSFLCTICGDNKVEKIAPIGHTESNWIIDKNATCFNNGYKHTECTFCHETIKTEEFKIEHTYDNGVITSKPTCLSEGVLTYTCLNCGDKKVKSITKLEHICSDWIVDTSSSCNSYGIKHKECTICGTILKTESISKLEHNYIVSDTKILTCTEDGYTEYKCTNCNETYKDNETFASGHIYGHIIETVKPLDFKTFGSANMICSNCNEILFHNLTAVKVDIGNGKYTTMYGYYDYEDAKKCFDLSYKYKEENGFISKYGFEWDEAKYNYACIRVAEMAYQLNEIQVASHDRPNGKNLGCGENLATNMHNFVGIDVQPMEWQAKDVFQSWLDSLGHRDNIEMKAYRKMVTSKFKVWLPKKENWGICWVQNFY